MEILRKMDKFSWKRYEAELAKHGYGVHIKENEDGTVYGYSIKRGNSSYKSSKLGVGRNLVPSKIMNTWHKLHPQEDKINRQECSLEDAHPLAKLEEIQHTALLLFAGYLDAATSMAASSGGGGSDTNGWGRDKDEDELEWARRCARTSKQMCKRRKGLHR